MSKITYIGGDYIENIGGSKKTYVKGDYEIHSNKQIIQTAEKGISFGEPESPPKREIVESKWKLESTYIHDHIKSEASEMVSKFSGDNTGIVYKIYKDIADGKIVNPPIVVTKSLHGGDAYYDEDNKKILIWETTLLMIEKYNDRKVKLIASLAEAYGKYINSILKESLSAKENLETYDYDFFKFDALNDAVVTIAKIESPNYKGNLDISFPKEQTEKPQTNHYKQDRNTRGGPNSGDFDNYEDANTNSGPGDDPPFNIGLKFSFSLGSGFTTSLYAGISREIAKVGDAHLMPSLNAALTYYGYGAPGTSPLSRHLLNATLTPAITLGVKTGNSLNMNLFTSFTGSGINNPYEYAFTLGSTGVLSSGKVTNTFDEKGNKIKKKDRERDQFNSQDNPNRNQIVGGVSIKVGNFMISSYNDIYKPYLFYGMDSDQYWSAGVNIQAKLTDKIIKAYAFDLYYGKSNNKNPYNLDKTIDGQNYDHQRLFDVLLNRGQETFTSTDVDGNSTQTTKFGYGTFWPSNKMHDTIEFPTKPKEPIKPTEPIDNSDEKLNKKYKENNIQYEKDLKSYERDLRNYNDSKDLKPNPKFHHIFVVYKDGSKEPCLERLKTYLDAEIPTKTKLLKEFYKLEEENKNK